MRSGAGLPLTLEDSWLPDALFPGIIEQDLGGSLYTLMGSATYGHAPVRAIERLEPVAARAADAEALGVRTRSPLMLVERVAYDAARRTRRVRPGSPSRRPRPVRRRGHARVDDLRVILARLEPDLGALEGEPEVLSGGITNRNLRVRLGGRDYVLRLCGKDTEVLSIDRETEVAATRAASAAGVAPEVVRWLPELQVLVTAFIPGRPMDAAELRDPRDARGRGGRAAAHPRRAGARDRVPDVHARARVRRRRRWRAAARCRPPIMRSRSSCPSASARCCAIARGTSRSPATTIS